MLKMTEAFSYARDCWEILTFVKASLLLGRWEVSIAE